MPKGVPVATVGIGNATNAGLLAARIIAASDPDLLERVLAYQVDANFCAACARLKELMCQDISQWQSNFSQD